MGYRGWQEVVWTFEEWGCEARVDAQGEAPEGEGGV